MASLSPFDFTPFAALRPGGGAFDHAGTDASAAEQAELDALDEDALVARVTAGEAAAKAKAEGEADSVKGRIASLDDAKKEMEAELAAARKEADKAGDAAAAEAWRARARRLQAELSSIARARSGAAARAVFRGADGYRGAFGGGGVVVGVGELGDDSFEAGFELELTEGADVASDAPDASKKDAVPSVRVRVSAAGPRNADGSLPGGGARCAVRLSKLGVRGEAGLGLINVDAERVTLRAEFTLEFTARYSAATAAAGGRGWAPHGPVRFDVSRLEQNVAGGLTLTDTGLPLLEMPPDLLRLAINLLLPRAVEEALQVALPPELGDYLRCAGSSARVRGSARSSGTPVAVSDANMCDDNNADAAAARLLAGVRDADAAKLLASALCDWRALRLPAGPDPKRAPERGRVSLGDLCRYAARVAAWGRPAELALCELWARAMARRSSGAPAVCVARCLAAARRLARKPVQAACTLHELAGGCNAHAALRAGAAAELRLNGGREEALLAQLRDALDACAANVHATSAQLRMRLADGVLEAVVEGARHEGPLSLWAALPGGLQTGAWDMRKPHLPTLYPPLPLLLRALIDQSETAAEGAEGLAEEPVLRCEALCPAAMCAPLPGDDVAEAVPCCADAEDCEGAPLTCLVAAEAAGLTCALVIDPAELAKAAAVSAGGSVPAVTLSLEMPPGGRGAGVDVAVRCAPGARLALALRRAGATVRVAAAARAASRYCAGVAAALRTAAAAGVAGAKEPAAAQPLAVLLRAAEGQLRGVAVAAALQLALRRAANGDLIIEARGADGDPEPVRADVAFKMADIAEEAEAIAAAVMKLHLARDEIAAAFPSWLKPLRPPPPLKTAAAAAVAEEAAEAAEAAAPADAAPAAAEQAPPAAAAPAKQQQGGFQLPFQNEIAGALRIFPGGGKKEEPKPEAAKKDEAKPAEEGLEKKE